MIAVIDSGSGGANVIKECMKYYNEDFVYLVDNKNCPYGNKRVEEIKKILQSNIQYLTNNFKLDLIIIGCNTASAILSNDEIEQINVPVIKTKPNMSSLTSNSNVACIFATKNTIKHSKYVRYYLYNYKNIKTLCIKNLPKCIDDKIATKIIKNEEKIQKKLKNGLIFRKNLQKHCKNIALGCTHFKHITKQIESVFNSNIVFCECEKQVAFLSRFFIRKSKNHSSVRVILTKQNLDLHKSICDLLL